MYILKNEKCSICDSDIEAIPYTSYNQKTLKRETVVSHCTCINCGENIVVPQDDFKLFIASNCVYKLDENKNKKY